MCDIRYFYNLHEGQTCLIIGNGPGLCDIPLGFLRQYPSFGANLITRLESFRPTYYVAVDKAIMEHQQEVNARLVGVPKFIPSRLLEWEDYRVYRWNHSPGSIGVSTGKEWPLRPGYAYACVTHVSLQMAYYMGFTTMLCVGLDNTDNGSHFYGQDKLGYPDLWEEGYQTLLDTYTAIHPPRKIINISTRTAVKCLPRADLRDYESQDD